MFDYLSSPDFVIFLQDLENGFFTFFFNFISFMGEEYVYIILLGFVYWTYNKTLGELLGLSLAFSAVVNTTIKNIVAAPRPFEEYPNEVTNFRESTATGHSFPSGHTQGFSSVLFAFVFYLKKRWILYTASIFVILMMFSRMYLGVHYLKDVLAGASIGILISFIMYYLFMKYKDEEKTLHLIYIGLGVSLLPFIFILDGEDFFKTYGLFIGFISAVIFEKRYVKFSLDTTNIKKVLRVIFGLVIVLIIQIGVKALYSSNIDEFTLTFNLLNMLRYFLMAFIGFGVYPKLFKRYNF
ncbi:MAG: phosphatase PAP2 family protein [Candidatus Izemoplasma sp.]